MRRSLAAALCAASFVALGACGGYSTPTPTGPDGSPSAPDGAIVIDVVRENGAQSFSPDPATIPAGRTVTWHNVDSITHHVVLDDGRLDAGNIAPGRYSAAMTLPAPGPYHCSIHPSMVGSLVQGQ